MYKLTLKEKGKFNEHVYVFEYLNDLVDFAENAMNHSVVPMEATFVFAEKGGKKNESV